MRLPYRFFLMIQTLAMLVFIALVVAVCFGWSYPLNYLSSYLQVGHNRWVVLGVVAMLFFSSCYLLVGALTTRGKRQSQYLIQQTGLGCVEIAASALENLICRAARQIREIRDVRPVLLQNEDGVLITLHLKVMPEANLPAVTQQVQQAVQGYLEEKAGVRVLQVKVLVDNVEHESRSRVE